MSFLRIDFWADCGMKLGRLYDALSLKIVSRPPARRGGVGRARPGRPGRGQDSSFPGRRKKLWRCPLWCIRMKILWIFSFGRSSVGPVVDFRIFHPAPGDVCALQKWQPAGWPQWQFRFVLWDSPGRWQFGKRRWPDGGWLEQFQPRHQPEQCAEKPGFQLRLRSG